MGVLMRSARQHPSATQACVSDVNSVSFKFVSQPAIEVKAFCMGWCLFLLDHERALLRNLLNAAILSPSDEKASR